MQIAIYGLGYVGLTGAGCLIREGHTVLGVEPNEDKVANLLLGKSPIYEPGLSELLAIGLKEGRFDVVSNVGDRLQAIDIAIVCVGTPSAPDGSHNMAHIAEVSRQIAHSLKGRRDGPLTVVYRSTIRPGTLDNLILPIFRRELGSEVHKYVELVYNPEFLRESVAIKDYFNPPKIVIGTADGNPSQRLVDLYRNINAPMFNCKFREAEFTKFVDNTWHAVKVAYANEIGRLCLEMGLSAAKIHEIFISDTKLNISAYYMRPGSAFGGSCLPKDVRALQYISGDEGLHTELIDSLIRSNESHKRYLFDHITRGLLPESRVLLVGLSFKAHSDDLRESPNVDLARRLLQANFALSIYDPYVKPESLIGQNLGYAYSHLPSMDDLLVTKSEVQSRQFDLVIDASGEANTLDIGEARVVNIKSIP